MIRPILFIAGYCSVSVRKCDGAAWANLCSRANIAYHPTGKTECDGEERLTFRLSAAAAVRARLLCEQIGIELRTEYQRGLPYAFLRAVRRPGLIAGFALCAVLVLLSNRVIWDVRVEGNRTVSAEAIEELLGECGIGVGTVKAGLDMGVIENRFLIESDEISWISVNVVGSIAQVEVRELVKAEQKEDFAASNLVAAQNGIVVSFEGVRGDIAVEPGEAVSEGQLLVGGVYGSETSPTRFVRARGSVIALCERDFSVSVPFKYDKKVYTGEKKTEKSIIFFDKEIKVFGNSRKIGDSCDIIEVEEYLDPFGLGKLPIGIRTVTYVEYRTQSAQRTEQQATEQANFILWDTFSRQAPKAQLVSKKISVRTRGDAVVLTARIESLEDIAKEVEIEIDLLE